MNMNKTDLILFKWRYVWLGFGIFCVLLGLFIGNKYEYWFSNPLSPLFMILSMILAGVGMAFMVTFPMLYTSKDDSNVKSRRE